MRPSTFSSSCRLSTAPVQTLIASTPELPIGVLAPVAVLESRMLIGKRLGEMAVMAEHLALRQLDVQACWCPSPNGTTDLRVRVDVINLKPIRRSTFGAGLSQQKVGSPLGSTESGLFVLSGSPSGRGSAGRRTDPNTGLANPRVGFPRIVIGVVFCELMAVLAVCFSGWHTDKRISD